MVWYEHFTVYSVQCSVQGTVYTAHYTLHSLLYSVQCTLNRGQTDYERYTWMGATYSLPNTKIPYQIWNSMSFSKEYVYSGGTAFHMTSLHRVYTVLASYPSF